MAVKFERFLELKLSALAEFHTILSRSWTKYLTTTEYHSYLQWINTWSHAMFSKHFSYACKSLYNIGTWWAGSHSGKPGFSGWPSFRPLVMIFVDRELEGARHRRSAGLRWVISKSTARSEQTFGCPMKWKESTWVKNKFKLIT